MSTTASTLADPPSPARILCNTLRTVRDLSLTDATLHALAFIADSDGEAAFSTVAREIGQTNAGMTHVADKLEKLGFIERRPSTADRRSILAVITQPGRDALAKLLTPAA